MFQKKKVVHKDALGKSFTAMKVRKMCVGFILGLFLSFAIWLVFHRLWISNGTLTLGDRMVMLSHLFYFQRGLNSSTSHIEFTLARLDMYKLHVEVF